MVTPQIIITFTDQNILLFLYQYHLFLYLPKSVSIKHHYNQKTSPFLRTSVLPFTLLDSYFQLSNIFILGTYGIYFNCSTIQMNSRHSPSLLPVLVKNKIYPTNPCKVSLRITVTPHCPHGSHYFYKFQELCFLEHSRIYSRSNFSKVDNSCLSAKVQPPLPSHSFLFP